MPSVKTAAARVLYEATTADNGRSAAILIHDGPLRQTILGLKAGEVLSEHNSPPAASIHVLEGRVRITGQDQSEIIAGDIVALTHVRHGVEALENSVFLNNCH